MIRLPDADLNTLPTWRQGRATGALVPCNPDTEIAAARQALENRWFVTFANLVASPQWAYASSYGTDSQRKELGLLAARLERIPLTITEEDIRREADFSDEPRCPIRTADDQGEERGTPPPSCPLRSDRRMLRLVSSFVGIFARRGRIVAAK